MLHLRSATLITAAGFALTLAGCARNASDGTSSDAAFCQNGSSCPGPTWFNANGEIIDRSPAEASPQYKGNSYASDSYRSDNDYNQRSDRNQSRAQWDNKRSDRDGASSGRADYRNDAWASASEDARILSALHAKNLHEIQMGQLAQQRGSSEEARRFGETLVRDHTDADGQVRSVANAANITLMEPDYVHAAMMREKADRSDRGAKMDHMAELKSLQGSDFDRAFGRNMADAHRECIEKVTAARANVSNAQVRALLDNLLPTLRQHEAAAQRLASQEVLPVARRGRQLTLNDRAGWHQVLASPVSLVDGLRREQLKDVRAEALL